MVIAASRYLGSLGGGFAVGVMPPLVRPVFGQAVGLVGAAIAAGSLLGNVAGR